MQLFFLFGKKYLKKERHACRSLPMFVNLFAQINTISLLRLKGSLNLIHYFLLKLLIYFAAKAESIIL